MTKNQDDGMAAIISYFYARATDDLWSYDLKVVLGQVKPPTTVKEFFELFGGRHD